MASLFPGSLTLGLGHSTPATEVPAFRWRRFGLPLGLFSSQFTLAPLVPMAAAEVAFLGTRLDQGFENHEEDGGRGDEGGGGADLLKKPRKRTAQGGGYRRGYLAGTANRMVTMLPIAMPDVIIDLDVGTLTKAVELESPAVQRNAACSLAHERWALSRRQQRRLRAAFEHETFVERMASSGMLTVAGLPGVVSGMAGGFLQLSAASTVCAVVGSPSPRNGAARPNHDGKAATLITSHVTE